MAETGSQRPERRAGKLFPMKKKNRDDFTKETKRKIAKRAGWLCSNPQCRRSTVGSNAGGDGEIVVGVAVHICAAASGGLNTIRP